MTFLSIIRVPTFNSTNFNSLSRNKKYYVHVNVKNKKMNHGVFSLPAKVYLNCSKGNKSYLYPTQQHQDKVDAFKVMFGNIAVLSFVGNLLLCVAICKRRHLLFKTYNQLVLNLAIADLLTGLLHACILRVYCSSFFRG